MTDLTADFADLINRRSAENDSDTPDIVLARFLTDVLAAFGTAVRERDRMTSDAYARGWNDCAATVSTALMVPLSSIADGISDAEAEASATFDLTIDEVRALKDKRESPAALVRQFHETFGVPIQDRPELVTEELAQARQHLLDSETAEVAEGVANGDLANIAQELADVVYVAYGTAIAYGIDLDAVLAEVHRANMSKLDADGLPLMRADGKVLKSAMYRPPDVAAVLGLTATTEGGS